MREEVTAETLAAAEESRPEPEPGGGDSEAEEVTVPVGGPAVPSGEDGEAEAAPPESAEERIARLERELTEKERLADDYLAHLQRLQADFENFRRRVRSERERLQAYAAESLLERLLPVLDNLELAVASARVNLDPGGLRQGVELTLRQFQEVLEKEGVSPMEAVGHPFDPALHEAIMQVETDEHGDNIIVVEELRRGYMYRDRVLRPAMVKVARSPQGGVAPRDQEDGTASS